MQPLLILGTHHFAPEVFDLVSDVAGYRVDGFVENLDRARTAEELEGLPVHWIDDAARFTRTHQAICALGTTQRSRLVEQAEALGFRFATIVHPTARVSSRSELGPGTLVSAGAVVATRTRIGAHVIVNRGALIGHDVEIGDYVTIGPGANVAGLCHVGDGTYLAAGSIVIDRVSVGPGAVVAAGAVVVRDVDPRTQVMGVPARVAKVGVEAR